MREFQVIKNLFTSFLHSNIFKSYRLLSIKRDPLGWYLFFLFSLPLNIQPSGKQSPLFLSFNTRWWFRTFYFLETIWTRNRTNPMNISFDLVHVFVKVFVVYHVDIFNRFDKCSIDQLSPQTIQRAIQQVIYTCRKETFCCFRRRKQRQSDDWMSETCFISTHKSSKVESEIKRRRNDSCARMIDMKRRQWRSTFFLSRNSSSDS